MCATCMWFFVAVVVDENPVQCDSPDRKRDPGCVKEHVMILVVLKDWISTNVKAHIAPINPHFIAAAKMSKVNFPSGKLPQLFIIERSNQRRRYIQQLVRWRDFKDIDHIWTRNDIQLLTVDDWMLGNIPVHVIKWLYRRSHACFWVWLRFTTRILHTTCSNIRRFPITC